MKAIVLLIAISMAAACKPAVGSRAWCEDMDDKPKGDWTANDTAEYLKSCIIRTDK